MNSTLFVLAALLLLQLAAAGKYGSVPGGCYSKCMRKKHRVRKFCDLRYCRVKRCGRGRYGARKFRCAPRRSEPEYEEPEYDEPDYVPVPVLPTCGGKCYHKYKKAARHCSHKYCTVVSCKIYYHGAYYNGYKCGAYALPSSTPSPTPSPSPKPFCDDHCYPKRKYHKVVKHCDPYYCKVKACYYSKYTWGGYKKTKKGFNCVHKYY